MSATITPINKPSRKSSKRIGNKIKANGLTRKKSNISAGPNSMIKFLIVFLKLKNPYF